jgi:hypothetical protein
VLRRSDLWFTSTADPASTLAGVRRLFAALAAPLLMLLAGCHGCQTEPATNVTYEAATLNGKGRCMGTYRVSWRYAYRPVGQSGWTQTPLRQADCPGPTSLAPLPSFRVRGLRSATRYEFRLEAGPIWFDAAGHDNGTGYDRFTTGAHPTATPRGAAELYDSVGVVIHLTYFDTVYDQSARLADRLAELGVRHVRQEIWANSGSQWRGWNDYFYQAVGRLAAKGIKFDYGFSMNPDAGSIAERLAVIAGRLAGTAASVEGPNEPDVFDPAGWEGGLRYFQPGLFASTKFHPSAAVRALPVIGPSFGRQTGPDAAGDLSPWLDFGNTHPYTGCASPNPTHLQGEFAKAAKVSAGKPVWATEAGFHNALDAGGTHPPCDERTAAIYVLRTVLEHFKAGIRRTFLYELIDLKPDPGGTDPQRHFGLLRNDFSPKPAFTALKNFLAVLGRAPAGTLAPLRTAVVDGPSDLRQLVLKRGDGSHLVILWRLASVWDRDRRRPIAVNPAPVEVSLPDARQVGLIIPTASTFEWPLPVQNGRVKLALGGEPAVLHVR